MMMLDTDSAQVSRLLAAREAASDALIAMDRLNTQQRDLLLYLCAGLTHDQAFDALGLTKATGYRECCRIRSLLEVSTMIEAAVIAVRAGAI